ncbi:hypothetical protein DK790_26010 [Escherichia coli]|nr:hypothetical protein [Escherichia coli]
MAFCELFSVSYIMLSLIFTADIPDFGENVMNLSITEYDLRSVNASQITFIGGSQYIPSQSGRLFFL